MADFEIWNDDDTIKLAPVSEGGVGLLIDNVFGGTPTATTEIHLLNNSGQDEEGLAVEVLARLSGGDNYLEEGNEFLSNGYLQARIKGDSAWQSLGPGSLLIIPSLFDTEFTVIELRISTLDDTGVSAWQVKIRIHRQPYFPLGKGFFEGIGNGVVSGFGDTSRSFLVDFSNVIQDPGGASDDVYVPKIFASILGVGAALKCDLVNIGTVDSLAATPASGEAFYAGLTFDGSTIVVTLGETNSTPLQDSDKPVLPSGKFLAWVTQDDTGNIDNSMISNEWSLDRFAITKSGLNIVVHNGYAEVNNNLLFHNKTTSFVLTDNADNYLALRNDRNFTLNTTGIFAQEKEMPLYIFTTLAGVITRVIDLRKFIGVEVRHIQLKATGNLLAIGDKSNGQYNYNRPGYIQSIKTSVYAGAGTGQTKVDINLSVNGGAFTTIFTDQTLRPNIAAASYHDNSSWPSVRKVEEFSRLQLEIDDIPGTTGPSDVIVDIIIEIP